MPTVARGRAGGGLDRGDDRAGARPRPVGHGEGRVAARHRHRGAAQHRLRGAAQLGVVEAVVGADDDDVRPGREVGSVEDPQPGVLDVAVDAAEPITNGRPPWPRSASTCCSAPPTVTTSSRDGLEAQAPQLAHDILLAVARVVGDEGEPLPARAARRDGLDRARASARRRPRRSRRGRAGRGQMCVGAERVSPRRLSCTGARPLSSPLVLAWHPRPAAATRRASLPLRRAAGAATAAQTTTSTAAARAARGRSRARRSPTPRAQG